MGKYDFSSVCKAWITENGNDYAKIRVESYWKNNAWTYHMQPVYGYTYCNGSEVCVYNAGYPDFRGDQYGQYLLGTHDYTITKNHGTQNINCQARCRSESSYVSGDKWSGVIGISVGARTSYTVSYNANGGSGAPGKQTKWYNENLTLSNSRPTRTGYSFTGWSGGYQPGQTYSGNASLNLTAQWKANTYTVSYNANGGSGAPGKQTKTYGVTLKLSSTKPTRTNYNFKGWATSPNGGVVYQPGGSYTNNSAITLYAVWELAYVLPRISNFTVQRCTSSGSASETGTYAKVSFKWSTDRTVSNIYIRWRLQSSTSWSSTKVTASGTSGSVSKIIGSGALSSENTYILQCYVQDSGGTTYSPELSVGTASFPIDVRKGGKGVAFGKAAEADNVFDVNYDVIFRKDAQANSKVVSKCGSDSSGSAGWYKVATQTMSGFGNTNILYYIKAGYNSKYYGILDLEMRANNSSITCWGCEWLMRSGFSQDHVRIVISGMTWTLYVYNPSGQYGRIYFSEIQARSINGDKPSWPINYFNSTTKESTAPTASFSTTTYKTKSLTSKSHSNWGTNNDYYPDMSFIAWWNGAYSGSNQSNLTYCSEGQIQAKPVSLYDNSSGTTGTVTLSQSAANFKYIEIFYNDGTGFGNVYHSTKIYGNNKTASLFSIASSDDSKMSMRYSTVNALVNNTSITISHGYAGWFNIEGASWWNVKEIKIVKVLGYK